MVKIKHGTKSGGGYWLSKSGRYTRGNSPTGLVKGYIRKGLWKSKHRCKVKHDLLSVNNWINLDYPPNEHRIRTISAGQAFCMPTRKAGQYEEGPGWFMNTTLSLRWTPVGPGKTTMDMIEPCVSSAQRRCPQSQGPEAVVGTEGIFSVCS